MAPAPSHAEVDAGLTHVLSDVPLHAGYAEVTGGFDSTSGGWARGEVGAHLAPSLGLFAFAQADQHAGVSAGAGARFTFNL